MTNLAEITREQIETALDNGRLEVQWRNGRWYAVRRNGQTHTLKRSPDRFRIPCKTGLKDCFSIGDKNCPTADHYLDSPYLRIKS